MGSGPSYEAVQERGVVRRLPFADCAFRTAYAIRMRNAAGRVDHVLVKIRRILAPDGRLLVYTRARQAEGDRLDPHNGAQRLAARMTERANEGDAEIGPDVPMEQHAVSGARH